MIPTGLSWASGLIQNNQFVFQVSPMDMTLLDSLNIISREQSIDYIIHFDIPQTVEYAEQLYRVKVKYPDVKIIALVLDYNMIFNLYKPYLSAVVSLTYKHQSAYEEFMNAGYKYYNIPLAADTSLFYKKESSYEYDVSFVGQFGNMHGHGNRDEDKYLFPILDDPRIKAFTAGFEYKNYLYNLINFENLPNIYNKTQVNLNFHYSFQKGPDRIDFNARTFEICATGEFQLCDHPYINELIPSMVVEPDSKKWKDLTYYYLENEDERKEIAQRCYSEVIQFHSWKVRMKQLLNYLENI